LQQRHPKLIDRIGPHTESTFVINPIGCPFALYLLSDLAHPSFKAVARTRFPDDHEVRIAGKLMTLLRLVDAEVDGDALFFSRDIVIRGTEFDPSGSMHL
tara:strand:- start:2310 stop:2609 length:300 start_codon:yes stop_codon:yes gene_type:complete